MLTPGRLRRLLPIILLLGACSGGTSSDPTPSPTAVSTTTPDAAPTPSSGDPTTTTPAEPESTFTLPAACTSESTICSSFVIEFDRDAEKLIFGFPDLPVADTSLAKVRLVSEDGTVTVECRAFGDVQNCGSVNPDQSLSNTFEFDLVPGSEAVTWSLDPGLFVSIMGPTPFSPAELAYTTLLGTGLQIILGDQWEVHAADIGQRFYRTGEVHLPDYAP